MNDDDFIWMAIEESRNGDGPYGAVLVNDGKVVARALNTADRDGDTTPHTEVNVIREALKTIPGIRRVALAREILPPYVYAASSQITLDGG